MAQAALIASAASSIFGGISAYSQAKGEQQMAKAQAYVGKTRAIQTSAAHLESLNSELGTLRATLAANGQPSGGGNYEFYRDLMKTRERERRIGFGNEMQGSRDSEMAAKNAGSKAWAGLIGGFGRAAPSLFDLYDLKKGN